MHSLFIMDTLLSMAKLSLLNTNISFIWNEWQNVLIYIRIGTGYKPRHVFADSIAYVQYIWGAMENWGLIVYREDLFLLDEQKGSYLDRINAALTISHEIAHNVRWNVVCYSKFVLIYQNMLFVYYIVYDLVSKFNAGLKSLLDRALDLMNGSGIKLSVKLTVTWWSVFGRACRGSTVALLLLWTAFQSWFAFEYSSCFICDESCFICSLFWFIDQ